MQLAIVLTILLLVQPSLQQVAVGQIIADAVVSGLTVILADILADVRRGVEHKIETLILKDIDLAGEKAEELGKDAVSAISKKLREIDWEKLRGDVRHLPNLVPKFSWESAIKGVEERFKNIDFEKVMKQWEEMNIGEVS